MREGWRLGTLKDAVRLHYGKALRAADRGVGDVPVVGSSGPFDSHHSGNTRTGGQSIVVGRKGTAGSVAWFDSPVWVTDTAYWAEPIGALSMEFLYLLLQYADLPAVTAQTGVPGLNRDRAYEIPAAIPPSQEQRRIVDLIGALDDTIAEAERNCRALQASLTALCLAWTTPRDDGVPLASVCDILDRHRRPISEAVRALRVGDVPYYGATGQVGWIDDAIFDEPLVLLWEDGGPVDEFRDRAQAYKVDGPAWVNNHAHVLRATSVPTDWLYYSLRHRDLRLHSSTGTRAKITQAQMRRIPIRVTDGMERMGRTLAQIESALVGATDLSSHLQVLRSNLLTALLSGEHEIPETYDDVLEAV